MLDEAGTRPDAGVPEPVDARRAGRRSPGAIVCAACRARVCDGSSRIEVGGHHQHTFFNPAGVMFRVACFSAAPGSQGVGPTSDEFTWFPGYRWQVALCAACGVHLGWHFHGPSAFCALIEPRIDEVHDGPAS